MKGLKFWTNLSKKYPFLLIIVFLPHALRVSKNHRKAFEFKTSLFSSQQHWGEGI